MMYASRVPGLKLAYEFLPGDGPVVMFCPGYASDMSGTKALALEAWCRAHKRPMLRFDYAGHGASEGVFTENGIGDWAADASFILEHAAPKRDVVLVGSSMGGWISLLLGGSLQDRLKAMLLIAPAPDFTETLLSRDLSAEQRATFEQTGIVYQASSYGAPLPFSRALIERSAAHLVMKDKIRITCPVRILHGMGDEAVPWRLSLKLVETLESQDVQVIYVKEGDHRLSSPGDLALLEQTLGALLS